MKSKLALLAAIVLFLSLPYAIAQTVSEREPVDATTELRREIAELKQRIAELEVRLARLEAARQVPGGVVRLRRQEPARGSYLRFPIEVERAMMGDAAALPQKLEGQYQLRPPTVEVPFGALEGDPRLTPGNE